MLRISVKKEGKKVLKPSIIVVSKCNGLGFGCFGCLFVCFEEKTAGDLLM